MPKIMVRDIEVNYEEAGEGFPLVLVHGLNGDLTGWVSIMPELSNHYRTVAMDVRGHGGTSKPDRPYSIRGFSEDLFEFLQKLGIRRAHLLGLSMGGAIAQQFALDHAEMIRSLVLVSTFSHIDNHAEGVLKALRESLLRGGYPAFFDEVVQLAFTPRYIAANPGPIAELKKKRIAINSPVAIGRAVDALEAFDLKAEISRISLPTLVVSGREDVFTPLHLAEQIHRSIPGSEWVILEGVGHNLHIEAAPQLAGAVLRFLEKH